MKTVKCSQCENKFEVSNNFLNVIVCEDCDPQMNGNNELESLRAENARLGEVLKKFAERECKEEYDWPTEEQELAREALKGRNE